MEHVNVLRGSDTFDIDANRVAHFLWYNLLSCACMCCDGGVCVFRTPAQTTVFSWIWDFGTSSASSPPNASSRLWNLPSGCQVSPPWPSLTKSLCWSQPAWTSWYEALKYPVFFTWFYLGFNSLCRVCVCVCVLRLCRYLVGEGGSAGKFVQLMLSYFKTNHYLFISLFFNLASYICL